MKDFDSKLTELITNALKEDIGNGDHSTLCCIDANKKGKAILKIKQPCIIAGINVAEKIFKHVEPTIIFTTYKKDGDEVQYGEIAFEVEANIHTILQCERLVLNCMQRMSGIATTTAAYVEKIKHTSARILDTRKTTPLNRHIEKWAVRIGGGHNHRFGLYDMIMIKDNHVDFAGGIAAAINAANHFLSENNLSIPIEIETRSIAEVEEVLQTGKIQRIMLDNFKPEVMREAVRIISHRYETEASGGIILDNVAAYAETGVDFISIGALTHSVRSLDLSLKAFK